MHARRALDPPQSNFLLLIVLRPHAEEVSPVFTVVNSQQKICLISLGMLRSGMQAAKMINIEVVSDTVW